MDGYWTNVLIFTSSLWTIFGIPAAVLFYCLAFENKDARWFVPAFLALVSWILAAVYCYMATGQL